jgi:hypothetical protein
LPLENIFDIAKFIIPCGDAKISTKKIHSGMEAGRVEFSTDLAVAVVAW